MKGSTRKRGSTWTAYWFTQDPATGSRKQHSKGGFPDEVGAAQEHLNEVLGKVQTGAWAPDKRITVAELLVEWLAAEEVAGPPGHDPGAVPERCRLLARATRGVASSWRRCRLRRRNSSSRSSGPRVPVPGRLVASIGTALHHRAQGCDGLGVRDGADGTRSSAGYRRPRAQTAKGAGAAWTADEARAFLASVCDDRLKTAWTLLLTRGLRRGELAGLKWDAVGLNAGSLQITSNAGPGRRRAD